MAEERWHLFSKDDEFIAASDGNTAAGLHDLGSEGCYIMFPGMQTIFMWNAHKHQPWLSVKADAKHIMLLTLL